MILTNFGLSCQNLKDILESPGLENIPHVLGNRAEVDQIHDARNVVSATVSLLK